MKKILMIINDEVLNTDLCIALRNENYDMKVAYDSVHIFELLEKEPFNLVLINVLDTQGIDLCSKITEQYNIATIFITDFVVERKQKFSLYEDNYATKNVDFLALRKRIIEVLKYSKGSNVIPKYKDGFLIINFKKRQVTKKGKIEALTRLECKLLKLFSFSRGQILTYESLIKKLYDSGEDSMEKTTLMLNVNHLRAKIESEQHKYIKTVSGMGYIWIGESYNKY